MSPRQLPTTHRSLPLVWLVLLALSLSVTTALGQEANRALKPLQKVTLQNS
ncbi:MAG: hypothetical protein U9R74_17265 [Pseudomonadota bacterium]|nr:hypothetical protein [Pseudomonadota bacterium]